MARVLVKLRKGKASLEPLSPVLSPPNEFMVPVVEQIQKKGRVEVDTRSSDARDKRSLTVGANAVEMEALRKLYKKGKLPGRT